VGEKVVVGYPRRTVGWIADVVVLVRASFQVHYASSMSARVGVARVCGNETSVRTKTVAEID
jgi:hypothetical protein